MLLEQLLNRTIRYYEANNIGLFEKRTVPVSFRNAGPNGKVIGKIVGTAKVDYFGFSKGHYYEFEAKQTKEDFLLMSSFQEHQLQRLQAVLEHGAYAFVIIALQQCEQIFLMSAECLLTMKRNGTKRITKAELQQKCPLLEIQTPGIIDFLAVV